jgi:hypothetical protein
MHLLLLMLQGQLRFGLRLRWQQLWEVLCTELPLTGGFGLVGGEERLVLVPLWAVFFIALWRPLCLQCWESRVLSHFFIDN